MKDTNNKNILISDGSIVEFNVPFDRLEDNIVPSKIAYQVIKDELMNEGNARMNLATFCQTKMDDEVIKLISETLEKNAIDKSEYPQTTEIENRCIRIIANLWNHPDAKNALGTSTIGSSEACMLAGMVMKFQWQDQIKNLIARKVLKEDPYRKPNLIISSAFQICWEKFATYWDVELRTIPITKTIDSLDLSKVLENIDENTIGIVGILGITYTGKYDNIQGLDKIVEAYNKQYIDKRPKIGINVDAASGGFFAPFLDPELNWDFKLKNVVSINSSGHKYGLVYPGIGWVLWKDKKFVPERLIFNVSYLGGTMPTMAINFSHSASHMIAQYYNFLHLGFKGYKAIHQATRNVAKTLAKDLESFGVFEIMNDGSNLPLVCWTIKSSAKIFWTLYDVSDKLLEKGWQVPTYPLPDDCEDVIISRIVCRADFSLDLENLFFKDIKEIITLFNVTYTKEHPSTSFIEKIKDKKGFTH